MNVVFFKLNHLGDNVVFLPVVQTLRERFPHWRLTVITTPLERELYRGTLDDADILTAEKLAFDKSWKRPWQLAAWWWKTLALRPDACLISFDQANISHLLAMASGASLRIGGNLEHIRFPGSLTHEVIAPAGAAPALWNWEMARVLARALGNAELASTPPPPDLSYLTAPVVHGTRARIVLHAGSRTHLTQWPADRFVELATRLVHDFDVVWIDRPDTAAAVLPSAITRIAPPSLRAFVTLLNSADLFVCNNSGPMHIANALGRRGVVISGPSALGWDPYWYSERWRVLRHPGLWCQPCEKTNKQLLSCKNAATPLACLTYWSVDAVEQICREHIALPLSATVR